MKTGITDRARTSRGGRASRRAVDRATRHGSAGASPSPHPRFSSPIFSRAPKILFLVSLLFTSQIGQAFACSVCFGAKDGKTTQHMAVAIWVMLGAIMSVMGGVGAFGFHLWRHSNLPLEPHQQLTEEDLQKYE